MHIQYEAASQVARFQSLMELLCLGLRHCSVKKWLTCLLPDKNGVVKECSPVFLQTFAMCPLKLHKRHTLSLCLRCFLECPDSPQVQQVKNGFWSLVDLDEI